MLLLTYLRLVELKFVLQHGMHDITSYISHCVRAAVAAVAAGDIAAVASGLGSLAVA